MASGPETRPRARALQAAVMRLVNVPMRRVLSLPFPTPVSRRLMLLQITGRRTGRIYRQPVSYIVDDGFLLTPGGGRWTLNLADGRPVPIRLRGRRITARAELVSEPKRVEELLERMISANPAVQRFVRIPRDGDGRLDRDALDLAIRHGFRIVRWHLAPGDLPASGG
jgi:hypothetical protein